MITTLLRALAAVSASVLLSGCLTYGAIEHRSGNLNEGIGSAQNRAILLNLVRAAHHEPLYFTSISSVQAQGAQDLKLAAPAVPEGPGLTNAARMLTWNAAGSTFFDNSTNTNFQMGVYNTQAFYSGMLAPLGLTEVDLLLHQGFSREMVFYLVIEKVKITDVANGESTILYNDPTSTSYPKFVGAVQAAMVHGLMTEVPLPAEGQDPGAAPAAAPPPAPAPPPATSSPNGPTPIAVAPRAPPEPELCFEKALASPLILDEFKMLTADNHPPKFCGETARAQKKSALTVRLFGKDQRVEVTTRSVYGLFRFLGEFVDGQTPSPTLVDYQVPSEASPTGPLFTVATAPSLGLGCFVAINHEEREYCVSRDGANNTKDVFNILSILVALKQAPGDLTASATVLIAP